MRVTTICLGLGLGLVAAAASSTQKSSDFDLSYTYPTQARAIPALRHWLHTQAAALRRTMVEEAAADRHDAVQERRPFQASTADRTWKVVTDTARFLSLSEERYDFDGGAHGNTSFAGLVYYRTTGARLQPLAFFTSPAALTAALRPAFCRQLDDERRRVRGGTLDSTMPEFARCIDPARETVILGSSAGRVSIGSAS